MKYALSTLSLAWYALCYTPALQPTYTTYSDCTCRKIFISATKTFCPLLPIKVTITRLYDGARRIAKFHRNTDRRLFVWQDTPGMVTLQADMTIGCEDKTYIYPRPVYIQELCNSEIYIEYIDTEPGFVIKLKPLCGEQCC